MSPITEAEQKLAQALEDLLGQMQQGAYVHMIEHSPTAKEAIAKAEKALGWEPGSSYCRE